MSNLEERVQVLERRFRDWIIGVSVVGGCLVAFAGFSWFDIPKRITAALDNKAIKEAERRAIEYSQIAAGAAERAGSSAAAAKAYLDELENKEDFIVKDGKVGIKTKDPVANLTIAENRNHWSHGIRILNY